MWIDASTAVWSNSSFSCLSSAIGDPVYSRTFRRRASLLSQASRTSDFVIKRGIQRAPALASGRARCHWRQAGLSRKSWSSKSTEDPARWKESFRKRERFCNNGIGYCTTLKASASLSGQEGKSTPDDGPGEPGSQSKASIYHPFIEFALQKLSMRGDICKLPIEDEFVNMVSSDGATIAENWEFASSKIRSFRISFIRNERSSIQILNVAAFSREEYDLPIFCADFVSLPNNNIVLLDLNQPRNGGIDNGYKERFFDKLMPLANKYLKVLPWGGKLTAESLQFFSPLVLWTRAQREDVSKYLYPAFVNYLEAWLDIVDHAVQDTDDAAIFANREAQHRYISWRVNKDPGFPLMTKLYGESLAVRFLKTFLFKGDALGTKSFVEHFPEYKQIDGSLSNRRSILGKAFESRPWDDMGNFIGLARHPSRGE